MIYYRDIKSIPVRECGEPLLHIGSYLSHAVCEHINSDMRPYTGDKMLLRKGCLERLEKAERLLRITMDGACFRIVYGYRHPEVQRNYFSRMYRAVKRKYPSLCEEDILEKTHQMIAVPDAAGHPTGGAVDLTLRVEGKDLDMGTDIMGFSAAEKISFFSSFITEKEKKNREILRYVMLKAGFAPYDGEWWHFSYGEKEWACYYQRPCAIYDQIYMEKKIDDR